MEAFLTGTAKHRIAAIQDPEVCTLSFLAAGTCTLYSTDGRRRDCEHVHKKGTWTIEEDAVVVCHWTHLKREHETSDEDYNDEQVDEKYDVVEKFVKAAPAGGLAAVNGEIADLAGS